MSDQVKKNNEKEENKLELVLQTKDLNHMLSLASSVGDKKSVDPKFGNVKLVAKDGIVTIGATDLDLYLTQTIGAEVVIEGESAVSGQTFRDVVKKIPDKEIRLKQEPGSLYLQIIASSCKFELLTLPTSEFPVMEDLEAESCLSMSCQELVRIIDYTSFAMSTEETRYNLNGIYLHVKNGEFASAATDAHRFSVAVSNLKDNIDDFGVIIPKKAVSELLKIIKDTRNINSDISIMLGVNKIKFKCNNLILISRLIDGNFPEYASFIPEGNKNKLSVNTKLLASAIDRVATITVDKFRAIKLIFNGSNLTITASGEAKGLANESIDFSEEKEKYCSFSGSSMTIGFNPKYITDVLDVLKESQVQFYLHDASSPVLIKTEENPKDNFVVMPVKV